MNSSVTTKEIRFVRSLIQDYNRRVNQLEDLEEQMIKVINNDIGVELLRKNETSANFMNDRIDEIIMEEYENETEGRLQDVQAQNIELSELVKELQNRIFEAEKDVSLTTLK